MKNFHKTVVFFKGWLPLWVNFCSTQKCINRDKLNFASKQRKLRQNGVNYDDTHNVEQNCLSHGAIFLHMTRKKCMWSQIAFNVEHFSSTKHAEIFMRSKIAPHGNICSTDNVRGVRDKYHVWYSIV